MVLGLGLGFGFRARVLVSIVKESVFKAEKERWSCLR